MTPDKAPRRWAIRAYTDKDGFFEFVEGPDTGDEVVLVIEASAYDAIEAELHRERRKVQKLREHLKLKSEYRGTDAYQLGMADAYEWLEVQLEAIDKGEG